jgi:hypothetical protein
MDQSLPVPAAVLVPQDEAVNSISTDEGRRKEQTQKLEQIRALLSDSAGKEAASKLVKGSCHIVVHLCRLDGPMFKRPIGWTSCRW